MGIPGPEPGWGQQMSAGDLLWYVWLQECDCMGVTVSVVCAHVTL